MWLLRAGEWGQMMHRIRNYPDKFPYETHPGFNDNLEMSAADICYYWGT
jgi:hypothetical protein